MGGAHGGGGNGGGGIGATMSCGDKQQQQGDGRLVQAALEAIALRKTLQLAGRLRQVCVCECVWGGMVHVCVWYMCVYGTYVFTSVCVYYSCTCSWS